MLKNINYDEVKIIKNIYTNKPIKIYMNSFVLLNIKPHKIYNVLNIVNDIIYKYKNNQKNNVDDFTDEELLILSNQNIKNKESKITYKMLEGLINNGNLYYEYSENLIIKFNL